MPALLWVCLLFAGAWPPFDPTPCFTLLLPVCTSLQVSGRAQCLRNGLEQWGVLGSFSVTRNG